MTQERVRTGQQVAFFGKEGTFETLPTMQPLIIEAGSYTSSFDTEKLEDLDSSPRLYDEQNNIDGLSKGGAKFSAKMRPHATQITGVAPTVPYPGFMQLLETLVGGLHVADGQAITAGTTSSVTVASTTGYEVGQVIGISGNGDNVPVVITALPGAGVINFTPHLGVAVTSGNVVPGFTAYARENNTNTGSFQHSYADSANAQDEYRGCIGKFTLKTELGQIMMTEFDLMGSACERGARGISRAKQTNPLVTGGHAIKNAIVLVQPVATTTRTNVQIESFSAEFDPGMEWEPSHAGTNGRGGAMRTKSRSATRVKIRQRFDTAKDAEVAARTAQRILYGVPVGSGTTKRWAIVYVPKAVMVQEPQPANEGGRLLYELTYGAQIDSTAAADSLAGAPIQYVLL